MARFSPLVLALALLAPVVTAFTVQRTPSFVRKHAGATTVSMALGDADEPIVLIGVAADSGCGKSTFMRRLVQK